MDDRGNVRKKDRRPFRRKGDIRAEGGSGNNEFSGVSNSRESDLEELMELDGEIIHLIMKRTQLLVNEALRRGGRDNVTVLTMLYTDEY